MAEEKSGAPPLPAFPPRLSLGQSIWEMVIDDKDDLTEDEAADAIEDDSDDMELMTDEFKADLHKLEVCSSVFRPSLLFVIIF